MAAAGQGHREVVVYLFEQPKIEAKRPKGSAGTTPILVAAGFGYLEVVPCVCEQPKVDTDKPDERDGTTSQPAGEH